MAASVYVALSADTSSSRKPTIDASLDNKEIRSGDLSVRRTKMLNLVRATLHGENRRGRRLMSTKLWLLLRLKTLCLRSPILIDRSDKLCIPFL
jgi:hypothetical protein